MQSLRSKEFSNNGIAVIYYFITLSSTFTCPKEIPLAADHAETIHNFQSFLSRRMFSSHLLGPRISLPSIAITPFHLLTDLFDPITEDQFKYSNISGFMMLRKNLLKVSWLGMNSRLDMWCSFLKKQFYWHCQIPQSHSELIKLGTQITAAMDI